MSLSVLHLLLLLAVILGTGAVALRALGIGPRGDGPFWCAAAFVVGTLVCGLVSVVWLTIGRALPGPALAPCTGALALVAWWPARRVRLAPPSPTVPGTRAGRVALVVALASVAVQSLDRAVASTAVPLTLGDGADIWSAKAHAMFAASTHTAVFGDLANASVLAPSHPPLIPLTMVWTFAGAGEPLHVETPLLVSGFVLALAFAVAGAVRSVAGPALAAAFVLLIHATRCVQDSGFVGGADVATACGLLLVVHAWSRWRSTGELAHWRLACVAAAALALTKREGEWQLVALALAAASVGRRHALPWPSGRTRAWLLLPLAAMLAYELSNILFGLVPDHFDEASGRTILSRVFEQAPARLPGVLLAFASADLHSPATFRWLPAAFVVALLAAPRRVLRGDGGTIAMTILLTLAAYVIVVAASPYPAGHYESAAVWRIGLHVVPLCALFVAAAAQRLDVERRRSSTTT